MIGDPSQPVPSPPDEPSGSSSDSQTQGDALLSDDWLAPLSDQPDQPGVTEHGLPSLPTLEPMDLGRRSPSARVERSFDVIPSTRQIMLPWCLWLLGSWAVSLWMDSPAAAIRWMLYSSLFGLMLVWPTYRLSQDGRSRSRRDRRLQDSKTDEPEPEQARPPRRMMLTPTLVFCDWLSMMMVFQAVIWPLRVTAGWEFEQAVWIDAAVASWSFLVGALTAWGCKFRHNVGRAAATVIVFLVMFAEPIVLSGIELLNERLGLSIPDWSMRLSPLETMYQLTVASGLFEPGPWRFNIVAVAVAGVLAWLITLIGWRGVNSPRPAATKV